MCIAPIENDKRKELRHALEQKAIESYLQQKVKRKKKKTQMFL